MLKIFDTHCHYNLEPLYSGKNGYFRQEQLKEVEEMTWQDHWQQAQAEGVKASLIAGACLESSKLAIKQASQEPNLFASVGLNPADFSKRTPFEKLLANLEQIKQLAVETCAVAIGEAGLDYFRLDNSQDELIQQQQDIFVQHLLLANQLQKTLIIHARDQGEQTYFDILALLKTHFNFKQPFILHCASGPAEYIQQTVKLGAYVSFAGNITYPNANHLRQLLALVPQDKLLIETDAPFLPPQPYRGRINQPFMIKSTAVYLQQEFKIDLEQVFNNSCQAFGVSLDSS